MSCIILPPKQWRIQTKARRAEKIFSGDRATSLSKSLDGPPHPPGPSYPLSEGLYPALLRSNVICEQKRIGPLNSKKYIIKYHSLKKPFFLYTDMKS